LDNRPIGIFDSGLGGLTVFKALREVLPNEDFIYVGDTARVPYGNKSIKKVNEYSSQICSWLVNENCKIIVVACNTVSAIALKTLKENFPVPIIGVIESGVNRAISITKNHKFAVLGTVATIKSDEYGLQIKKQSSKSKVISLACPLFVPLVEEGLTKGDIPTQIIKMYLTDIKNLELDTIILGCTHYPLLKDLIQEFFGDKINLIDSGDSVGYEVKTFISDKNLKTNKKVGSFNCFVTDEPEAFDKHAKKFLKVKLVGTSHIELV
jgi:glutamate racemase